MPRTRRAQILMDPSDYERLEEIARRRGSSVAELVRDAVAARYFVPKATRRRALARIFRIEVPMADWGTWEEIREEIQRARLEGLP